MPLVLHKLVKGNPTSWEDVNQEVFTKLVDFVRPFCSVIGIDNPQVNGWSLTFDDGNLSDYDIAFPILGERGVRATFFLIVDKIGEDGYLNWAQISEMNRHGMNFGSHSLTHQSMVKLSQNMMMNEFVQSKHLLEDKLGIEITSFSYPFGEYTSEINKFCFDAGYQFAFTSKHGVVNEKSALIPRNSINSSMQWDDVVAILNLKMHTRLRWVLEDNAIKVIKNIIGRERYTYFRDKVLNE